MIFREGEKTHFKAAKITREKTKKDESFLFVFVSKIANIKDFFLITALKNAFFRNTSLSFSVEVAFPKLNRPDITAPVDWA